MLYLIDGYNLLHQLGVLRVRAGSKGLEKARYRLLGLLRGGFGADAASVTVVFDAAHPPPGAAAEQDFHGIHVRFAVQEKEADELIELLIRQTAVPRQLTVVSDDHRIQRATRRRRCVVQGCGDFLLWLERRRPTTLPTAEALAKPVEPTEADTAHWLREFADLDSDPDFKEVFNPFDFEAP